MLAQHRAYHSPLRGHNAMNHGFVLVDDELFDAHVSESLHPERPARLRAARQALTMLSNVPHELLPARDATDAELALAHTEAYIRRFDQAAGNRGYFDADTYYGPQSVPAARRAAGGVLSMVECLASTPTKLGVALVRPPGHHATADHAMGFCLLNNVAIAAAHARARGMERILILDWDVHHGNGTEAIFYDEPGVLYMSLHQSPFYPGTGAATDRGVEDGQGYTVNIPLSAGADQAVYLAAFERLVTPIVNQYAPELVLISAGFDAHARDPLASMALEAQSYGALFESLFAALPGLPSGGVPGIGIVLEGGYDLTALSQSLQATLEVAHDCALGQRPKARPVLGQQLSAQHERDLERACLAQREHWKLE